MKEEEAEAGLGGAAKAAAFLREIAELVRGDTAPEARARLQARLEEALGAEEAACYAVAAALLDCRDLPPMSAASVERALAPLLRAAPEAGLAARLLTAATNVAATPGAPAPRIELACLLLSLDEPAWAEQAMLPIWQGRETDWLAARVLSGIWAVLGRQEEALEAAEVAATKMPGSADVHIHHAGMLLNNLQPGPALLAAGRALGIEAENAVAWRLAAAAMLQLGHVRDAIAASGKAAAHSEEQRGFAEEIAVAAAADVAIPVAAPLAAPPEPAPVAAWARVPAHLPALAAPPSLRRHFAVRLRVMDALMLREARSMFGHSRLGYTWALFEPMMHVFILSIVLYAFGHGGTAPIGDSLPLFYMTGVLPYLLFCHLSETGMDLARQNRAVLQIPLVGVGDVILARIQLRTATDIIVMLVCLGTYMVVGVADPPADPLQVLLVYLVLMGFGGGCALITCVASSHSSLVERFWPIFLRAQYFTCGVFYHPDMMPPDVRAVLLYNPMVHVLEWFREGFYGHYRSPYLDTGFLLQWTVGTVALGMLLLVANRRHLRLPG